MEIDIRRVADDDRPWVLEFFRNWGADFVISRGRKVFAADIDGFIARDKEGKPVGLATFEVVGDQCEIITLDALVKYSGIGTALIESVKEEIREKAVRLWLMTTNDNVDAIRFYQKRGFTIAAVYPNSIEQSRRMKPSIPMIGFYGIPIRDEIEFEMLLER